MALIKTLELKNLLLSLKNVAKNSSAVTSIGSKIFLGFYEIVENKEFPSKEDKIEIIKLASDSSVNLIDYAERYVTRFYLTWEEDELLTCKLQSGFQFFKDDYVNCLINDLEPKLRESTQKLIENLDYEEMDNCMTKWTQNTSNYQPPRPEFIPKTHFWWHSK